MRKQMLREIAGFASGLVAADFLCGWWLSWIAMAAPACLSYVSFHPALFSSPPRRS